MQIQSLLTWFSPSCAALLAAAIATALPTIAQPVAAQGLQPAEIAQASAAKPMTTIAEEFVNLAAKGDYAAASQYLHPTLRQNWTTQDMQRSWESLQQRTGAFQTFLGSQQADNKVVLVNTQFANVTDDLVIIFDDTEQWIVGVDFPQQ